MLKSVKFSSSQKAMPLMEINQIGSPIRSTKCFSSYSSRELQYYFLGCDVNVIKSLVTFTLAVEWGVEIFLMLRQPFFAKPGRV